MPSAFHACIYSGEWATGEAGEATAELRLRDKREHTQC